MRKVFVFALIILTFFTLHFSFLKAYAENTLPPCAVWAYYYPKDDPNSKLNGTVIPTDNPQYTDANFTYRKCTEVQTAIGQIGTEPQAFVRSIYSIVLGLSGGIALVLIIIAGYKTMSSGGDPEKVKSANEGLTSAVIGLLFIIFAFVILQIVGVDILRIPGFTK